MEASELVAEALGEHVFDYFIRNKREEWDDYKAQVTPWEIERYLGTAVSDRCASEPLLVFPDPPPPLLAQTLDLGGLPVEGRGERVGRGGERAARRLGRRGRRGRRRPRGRVRDLPLAAQARRARSSRCCSSSAARSSPSSSTARTCSTTSASSPFHPKELEARLRHLFWRTGRGTQAEIVEYGGLVLNLETYQAALDDRPLDLTYMEYELLKFFAHPPGQGVHARAAALARVGLRVLRRRAHGRRARPAAAGEARRGAREPDPDRALRRLPLRPARRERRGRASVASCAGAHASSSSW